MKQNRLPILFCFLFCANVGLAQNKQTLEAAESIFDNSLLDATDTLFVKTNRPVVFLINVSKGSVIATNDSEQAEAVELRTNFEENALKIVKINQHLLIMLENKTFLDLRDTDTHYEYFAYWDGNMTHKMQIKTGTKMATEFVAAQMGLQKESSYVVNGRKYKAELSALTLKNNITDKSKQVLKALLFKTASIITNDGGIYAGLFNIKSRNIKNIDAYLTKNGKKNPLKSITFNEMGQVTTTKTYSSSGSGKLIKETNLLYKNNMLSQIISEGDSVINIFYENEKMIFVKKMAESTTTIVYWLENGELLMKMYDITNNKDFDPTNNFCLEYKTEGDCIVDYKNNKIKKKTCAGNKGIFPYIFTQYFYQNDGEIAEFSKGKIEKKDSKTYELFYSKVEDETQADNYYLYGTIHLNKQEDVKTLETLEADKKSRMDIEYSYFSK